MEHNTNSQILMTPLKPALIAGMTQKLPVLVRIQAPDPDPTLQKNRKPYHLALVLDRSGSMHGEPLLEALRCTRYILDQLSPSDVVSLTVFDNNVNTLVNAQPVGNGQVLHHALSQISSGGSTNLHGGWQAGANTLLNTAQDAALARVILLSDGQANTGDTTDTQTIANLCAQAAEHGITTSTYGLGRGFNEDLMVAMGERGGGNHYYGDTAADLFEPFAEEFDFISNLYARHLRLALATVEGVKMTIQTEYPIEERDGFPLIRLPDLPLGAEAWVLVELEIPAQLAGATPSMLLQAGITASTPDGIPINVPDATLTLPSLSPSAWDALVSDPLVVTRQIEVEAGQWLARARSLANAGNWQGIEAMIAEGRLRFAGHTWVMDVLENLVELARNMDATRFSKESLYGSKKMASRLARKHEGHWNEAEEASAPSYLRRKRAQGKAQFNQRPSDPPSS